MIYGSKLGASPLAIERRALPVTDDRVAVQSCDGRIQIWSLDVDLDPDPPPGVEQARGGPPRKCEVSAKARMQLLVSVVPRGCLCGVMMCEHGRVSAQPDGFWFESTTRRTSLSGFKAKVLISLAWFEAITSHMGMRVDDPPVGFKLLLPT